MKNILCFGDSNTWGYNPETKDIDSVILMLGTNDCKTYYGNSEREIAKKTNVHFLVASEYADPSKSDQEHLDEVGHSNLANAIFESVKLNWKCA